MAKYTSSKWGLAVFSLDPVRPGGRLLGSRQFRIDHDRRELCFARLPQPVVASGDQGDGLEHDREVRRPQRRFARARGQYSGSIALERKIADFLEMPEAVLFPTGWAAGYGVIRGLVRSADHIVMDALAHVCLQEGANAATRNIYIHRHLDLDHCRHWLAEDPRQRHRKRHHGRDRGAVLDGFGHAGHRRPAGPLP